MASVTPTDRHAPGRTDGDPGLEMPGGQYNNPQKQARAMGLGGRWPEVARADAEVNLLIA